jgi:hypothetical protein
MYAPLSHAMVQRVVRHRVHFVVTLLSTFSSGPLFHH